MSPPGDVEWRFGRGAPCEWLFLGSVAGFRPADVGYSEDEVRRLNRRIELRQFTAGETQAWGE